MTQDYILVSPTPSACLKPGNSSDLRPSLGLRHSSASDTHSLTALDSAERGVSSHYAICNLHSELVLSAVAGDTSPDVAAPIRLRVPLLPFRSFPWRPLGPFCPLGPSLSNLAKNSKLGRIAAAAAVLLPRLTQIFRISTQFLNEQKTPSTHHLL